VPSFLLTTSRFGGTLMKLYETILKGYNGDQEATEKYIKMFENSINKHARMLNYDEAKTDLIISMIEQMGSILKALPVDADDPLIIYYIVRKLRYTRIDLFRKNRVRKFEIIPTEMIEEISVDSSDSTLLFFHDLIKVLNPKQKMIMIMRYIDNCSDEEISKELDISRQAVHKQRTKALSILRDQFEEVV